jgi:hypothetical protein
VAAATAANVGRGVGDASATLEFDPPFPFATSFHVPFLFSIFYFLFYLFQKIKNPFIIYIINLFAELHLHNY